MVEGHGVSRVAWTHRKLLVGHKFRALSPNGRFTEGAQLINGSILSRIEAVGKNLFYFFAKSATDPDPVCVHIHFGMSGEFRLLPLSGAGAMDPRPTCRLRLESSELNMAAHLSAMTCQHGGMELYTEKRSKLGPDPLREDADPEEFFSHCRSTSKPIGLVLMDQSKISGVGNIFRAEILFKSGVHPEQPASSLSDTDLRRVWYHSVDLLQRGFLSGSILTVDKDDARVLGPPWTRRYVYNHKTCGRCLTSVSTWDMASRTVYACLTCQALQEGTAVAEGRKKALAASKPVREFVSHCAAEGTDTIVPGKMTVAQLKTKLAEHGLPSGGNKGQLVARLTEAVASAAGPGAPAAAPAAAAAAAEVEVVAVAAVSRPGRALGFDARTDFAIRVGSSHLGSITSAADAALEKMLAGENRAVEHIALHDPEEMAAIRLGVAAAAALEEEEEEEEEEREKPARATKTPTKRKAAAEGIDVVDQPLAAAARPRARRALAACAALAAADEATVVEEKEGVVGRDSRSRRREFAADVAHTGDRTLL